MDTERNDYEKYRMNTIQADSFDFDNSSGAIRSDLFCRCKQQCE